MKILITGSRKLNTTTAKAQLKKELEKLEGATTLLHGGAKGVDQLADDLGREMGLQLEIIKPDYQAYHYRQAPLMRNTELVKRCDQVIALYAPDRIRKGGTWDTVQKALKAGKPVTELLPDGRTIDHRPATLF